MKVYSFFRSGSSHRLRIALNLKGLDYDLIPVNLRQNQHLTPAFSAINPQRLVPAVELEGTVLTQTPAIIEWLEEQYPTPPLLPAQPLARAQVRALAAVIGCDVHPLQNRRVQEALRGSLEADEAAVTAWCARWIGAGFDAYTGLLERLRFPGDFSFGDHPTVADVYLVPQIEAARRFGVDLGRWPRLLAIDAACAALPAFQKALPHLQPDAE